MRNLCSVLLLAGALRAQELPHATAEYGAFAFPDATGARLLTLGPLPQPAALHTALCEGGLRFPVRFLRRQAERENNGRQTAANFDRLPGNVYAVLRGRVASDATCFLAGDDLLRGATLLASRPGECGEETRRRIASSRGRALANCWTLAGPVLLVEFVRQDKSALASVVVQDRGRMIFADYPAESRQEGGDLWRVDDGGVLSPQWFRVVFLLQRGTFYSLGVNWLGAEGDNLTVFASNGADRFTEVIKDYWYRAPL
jgi:hypothetical protein